LDVSSRTTFVAVIADGSWNDPPLNPSIAKLVDVTSEIGIVIWVDCV